MVQYSAGTVDFTTVTQIQQTLVLQQDTLAQAEGEIATGLIQVYRALGGGWQIRLGGCNANLPPPGVAPAPWQPPAESIEAPKPRLARWPPGPNRCNSIRRASDSARQGTMTIARSASEGIRLASRNAPTSSLAHQG